MLSNLLSSGQTASPCLPACSCSCFLHHELTCRMRTRPGSDSEKETFQRGQIRAANGHGPPNQCQGSDENRSHAHGRVQSASVVTALACRVQFHSDKRVKWSRFLPPETFPPGTAHRSWGRLAAMSVSAAREVPARDVHRSSRTPCPSPEDKRRQECRRGRQRCLRHAWERNSDQGCFSRS